MFTDIICFLFLHICHQPSNITALQAVCFISLPLQFFCDIPADLSSAAADNDLLFLIFRRILHQYICWACRRIRQDSMGALNLATDIKKLVGLCRKRFHFLDRNIYTHWFSPCKKNVPWHIILFIEQKVPSGLLSNKKCACIGTYHSIISASGQREIHPKILDFRLSHSIFNTPDCRNSYNTLNSTIYRPVPTAILISVLCFHL